MLIVGVWQLCDDGVMRPMVHAQVFGADGRPYAEDFLVDSGADRTVLSAGAKPGGWYRRRWAGWTSWSLPRKHAPPGVGPGTPVPR